MRSLPANCDHGGTSGAVHAIDELTMERQVSNDLAVEITYAGKLAQKLEGHRHWNPAVFEPDPITGAPASAQNVNNRVLYPQTISLFNTQSRVLGNDFRSAYHSAQLKVNKRFSRGFSFLSSYVFSKGIDDVVAPQAGLTPGVGDPFNLKLDKGRGNYDHTHVFNMRLDLTQNHKFYEEAYRVHSRRLEHRRAAHDSDRLTAHVLHGYRYRLERYPDKHPFSMRSWCLE
ncbi:MAG: hypothetical protein WKF37_08955 [Bryobacteraceae bacterium]